MKTILAITMMCMLFPGIISPGGFAQAMDMSGLPSRIITDAAGRKTRIPRSVGRVVITCYGGATQEVSVLGGADTIIAQPSTQRFPQLLKMYPRFTATPDAGSFDTVNIEHIIALKPDLVIAGITSLRGNKKIEDAGIPVVTVAIGRADIDGLLKEFSVMGRVFGTEKRADALVSYWKERLSYIRKRVSGMPGRKRKKVFYMGSEAPLSTEGRLWWGQHFISAAGGVNVSRDIGQARQVTVEQLLVWNPDVIVMPNNRSPPSTGSAIKGNHRMRNVKAVKDNRVYACPVGAFWWDRPSPEAILGILWLAKILYPEQMRSLDLKKETMLFYKKFYTYSLSAAEYESFF
jgi:iron complex transport system substrate-binding protein